MDQKLLKSTFLSLLITLIITLSTAAFNDYDKVLLSDVKVLTLHQGQMTNARRSPPVPQLKCVGGSAQYKFTPKVVQCYNRGSDGFDIQWECKTDMDNAYRFGNVEVTCEGYDYPNDPYVLKGSCGLEYTIDLTEEGMHREKQKGGYGYQNSYHYTNYKESTGGLGGLFVFAGVLFAMYIIYKVCIAPSAHPRVPGATTGPGPAQPPPYGFRPEYMPNQDPPPPYDDYSTHSQSTPFGTQGSPAYDYPRGSAYPKPGYSYHTNATGGTGGGFWTGAAAGGLLGYLFGGRNSNYHYGGGYRPRDSMFGSSHYSGGSNTGGSFFSSSSSSSSGSGSGSSGTRTASGFGGTSRR